MSVSERMLFLAATKLYRFDISQPAVARESTLSKAETARQRSTESKRILAAAADFGIEVTGRSVLDFGCHDGAVTVDYLDAGADEVVGVDIDKSAIERARDLYGRAGLTFVNSSPETIPLPDDKFDVVISYDVFEHVNNVPAALEELYRVIRPGGRALIGVCGGWHHPFAPHLRAVMPVPWAHVMFSEKTVLSACRRVYESDWYTPQHYDLDQNGVKLKGRYEGEKISEDYLNKYLIRDFERALDESKFDYTTHLVPFGHKFANLLLTIPWLRELCTGYVWFVLTKPLAEK